MSQNNGENTPLLLQKKPPKREKQLKYHVFFFILLLLLFLFLFLLLRMGPDILPFAMFILFFSIPLLVLFSKHLVDVVPARLAKILTEDVEVVKDTRKSTFFTATGRVSNRNKQYILLAFLIIICITLIQLLRTLINQVDPNSNIPATRKITIRLIISIALAIFGCVITQNFYEITTDYYGVNTCATA